MTDPTCPVSGFGCSSCSVHCRRLPWLSPINPISRDGLAEQASLENRLTELERKVDALATALHRDACHSMTLDEDDANTQSLARGLRATGDPRLD
jgi:hypothetical protein